jgi:hypothetical protein
MRPTFSISSDSIEDIASAIGFTLVSRVRTWRALRLVTHRDHRIECEGTREQVTTWILERARLVDAGFIRVEMDRDSGDIRPERWECVNPDSTTVVEFCDSGVELFHLIGDDARYDYPTVHDALRGHGRIA